MKKIVFITPEGYEILKTIVFSTFPASGVMKTIFLAIPEGEGGVPKRLRNQKHTDYALYFVGFIPRWRCTYRVK